MDLILSFFMVSINKYIYNFFEVISIKISIKLEIIFEFLINSYYNLINA